LVNQSLIEAIKATGINPEKRNELISQAMNSFLADPESINIEDIVETYVKYGYYSALVSLCLRKI